MRGSNMVKVEEIDKMDGTGEYTIYDIDAPTDSADRFKLNLFARDLRDVFPDIKFACAFSGTSGRVENANRYLHLYTASDEWCWGWIAYADVKLERTGDKTYCVYSRKVSNKKYDMHRDQHHTVMTANREVAVRNAKRYLSPFTHKEIVDYSCARVSAAIDHHQETLEKELREIREPLTKNLRVSNSDGGVPQLYAELFHLADINHEFLSKEFTTRVRNIREAYKVACEGKNNMPEMYCVRVYQHVRRKVQLFDVVTTTNLAAGFWSRTQRVVGDPTTYTDENIPEEIMGKLAVLSISGVGEYVHDVGYRESEGIFYVTR